MLASHGLSCTPSHCMNVSGKARTEEAKMTGMTPPVLSRSGMCVCMPPYIRRPTTRRAYCTGIFLWARSTQTIAATTSTIIATSRTTLSTPRLPVVTSWYSVTTAFGSPTMMPA